MSPFRLRGTRLSRRLQRIPGVRRAAISSLLRWEHWRTGAVYCPFGKAHHRDPGPGYLELVSKKPVHKSALFNRWIVSGHSEAMAVLRDTTFSSRVQPFGGPPIVNAFHKFLGGTMLESDPPDHARLRTAVNRAFTPARVEEARPFIEAEAARLLSNLTNRESFDLVSEFAAPLAATVIAHFVGAAGADHDRFPAWIRAMTALLDPACAPEFYGPGNKATVDSVAHVERLMGSVVPGDGSIAGTLLLALKQEPGLTPDEATNALLFLLLAGQETATNLICNAVHLLLTAGHPLGGVAARGETYVAEAIDEVLRLGSPIQVLTRVATETREIGGRTIQVGEGLIIVLGAANVDPREFSDPLAFAIGRRRTHVAFGHGPHYCLGASLARLEAALALTTLATTFPNLRLMEPEPQFRPVIVFRGPQRLMVSPGPAAPSPVPTP